MHFHRRAWRADVFQPTDATNRIGRMTVAELDRQIQPLACLMGKETARLLACSRFDGVQQRTAAVFAPLDDHALSHVDLYAYVRAPTRRATSLTTAMKTVRPTIDRNCARVSAEDASSTKITARIARASRVRNG